MQLRPYQNEAKNAVFREWESGNLKTLLVLPTGCGKTIVLQKSPKNVSVEVTGC